jgi:hypothetical protein
MPLEREQEDYLNFYEVTDQQAIAVWGGGDTVEAVKFFRQSTDQRIFVSVWVDEDEDAHLVSGPIEITRLIIDTIKDTLERAV